MFGVPGTEYTDARGFAELRWEHAFQKVTLDAQVSYDGSRFRGYYAQLDAQGDRFRARNQCRAGRLAAAIAAKAPADSEGFLVREDALAAYPVRGGIPALLPESLIPLGSTISPIS
jgi:uncharacterized protein YbaR (Trm112 family)